MSFDAETRRCAFCWGLCWVESFSSRPNKQTHTGGPSNASHADETFRHAQWHAPQNAPGTEFAEFETSRDTWHAVPGRWSRQSSPSVSSEEHHRDAFLRWRESRSHTERVYTSHRGGEARPPIVLACWQRGMESDAYIHSDTCVHPERTHKHLQQVLGVTSSPQRQPLTQIRKCSGPQASPPAWPRPPSPTSLCSYLPHSGPYPSALAAGFRA